jgi:hypothetical protein
MWLWSIPAFSVTTLEAVANTFSAAWSIVWKSRE